MYLNQVLAFCFRYQWLELWCCECVYQAGLGDDEEQYLGTREDRQFIRLWLDQQSKRRQQGPNCVARLPAHTFFMIPAFRLEKVMCRRDLS